MIIGLLSWYDEDPTWLVRAIAGVGRFADHVVAIDGAYEALGGAHEKPVSSGDQAEAIVAACDGAGMGLTLHRPTMPWVGNEVAKRDFMFRAAGLVAEPGDWLFSFDADELPVEVPADVREQLDAAAADGFQVATIHLETPPHRGSDALRRFFRYDPTIRAAGRHYMFLVGPDDDPRFLQGAGGDERVLPATHIDGFRSEHWTGKRHPYRAEAQYKYYARRQQMRLEHDV